MKLTFGLALVALVAAAPAAAERVIAHTGEAVEVTGPRAQEVADLLASFPHGPELATVRVTVVSPEQAENDCWGGVACYFPRTATIELPETSGEFPWEQVLAHEYGHHVAASRANPPWKSTETGPKRWATVARVCGMNPIGGLLRYRLDPREGFAEAYRLAVAAQTPTWTPFPLIVDGSVFPMGTAALAAAIADVTTPWTARRTWTETRRLRAGATVTIRLATPLDGALDAALVGGRGSLRAEGWPAGRRVSTTVCGRRTTALRLKAARSGVFRISVTAP